MTMPLNRAKELLQS